MKFTESLGSFASDPTPLSRNFLSSYDIYVQFPTSLTVALTDITISSIAPIEMALTLEKYDVDTRVLTVELSTAVGYSYMLVADSNTTFAAPQAVSAADAVGLVNTACGVGVASICMQKIVLKLALLADENNVTGCVFDGVYELDIGLYACRENGGSGCINTPAHISFTLASENVCGRVSLQPVITSSLVATKSLGGDAVSSFALGEKLYFNLDVNAGTGNTLSVAFVNISFDDNSGSGVKNLLINKQPTTAGNTTTLTVANSERYFSLYLHGGAFNFAMSNMKTYTFRVACEGTACFYVCMCFVCACVRMLVHVRCVA